MRSSRRLATRRHRAGCRRRSRCGSPGCPHDIAYRAACRGWPVTIRLLVIRVAPYVGLALLLVARR